MTQQEIQDAKTALKVAENHFNAVIEPAQIDIATWQLTAAKMRLNAAYAKAKVQVKRHAEDRMEVLSIQR